MKIIRKKILVDRPPRVHSLEVEAPAIARKVRPGQFVVVMASEKGERIPLTVVERNIDQGTVTLIFQEIGLTTGLLASRKPGESLYALLGPLGNPSEIGDYDRVIAVAGGVGTAETYPVVRALKEKGNQVTVIVGAKNKDSLILERELAEVCDRLIITTDDGSYGEKGFTTDILRSVLSETPLSPRTLIYSVGPVVMMSKVVELARETEARVIVSLNALMIDGTGMCGVCRVRVGDTVKFTCIDGPEFDGRLIDWPEVLNRSRMYQDKEKHICNLYKIQPGEKKE